MMTMRQRFSLTTTAVMATMMTMLLIVFSTTVIPAFAQSSTDSSISNGNAVLLDSCQKQNGCIEFTFELLGNRTCSTDRCDYNVCMNIDYTKPACLKGHSGSLAVATPSTIAGTCVKLPNSTNCLNPSRLPGFGNAFAKYQSGITHGHKQCQIVRAGSIAEFLINDGTCNAGSLSRTLFMPTVTSTIKYNNVNIKCDPFRSSSTFKSCTNLSDTSDCLWRVQTPSDLCTTGSSTVSTNDIERNFSSYQNFFVQAKDKAIAIIRKAEQTDMRRISLNNSFPFRQVRDTIFSMNDDLKSIDSTLASVNSIVGSWNNNTNTNHYGNAAIRLASIETKASTITNISDKFVADKAAVDSDMVSISNTFIELQDLIALCRAEVEKIEKGTSAQSRVIGICNSTMQNSLNNLQKSYNDRIKFANTSEFNPTEIKKLFNETVLTRTNFGTALSSAVTTTTLYVEARKLYISAIPVVTRLSDIASTGESQINARVSTSCNSTNATCFALVKLSVDRAKNNATEARFFLSDANGKSNEGNFNTTRTLVDNINRNFIFILNNINTGRTITNLPLDDADKDISMKNFATHFAEERRNAADDLLLAQTIQSTVNATYETTRKDILSTVTANTKALSDSNNILLSSVSTNVPIITRNVNSIINAINQTLLVPGTIRLNINDILKFRDIVNNDINRVNVIVTAFRNSKNIADRALALTNRTQNISATANRDCASRITLSCGTNTTCSRSITDTISRMNAALVLANTAVTSAYRDAGEYRDSSSNFNVSVARQLDVLKEANLCRAITGLPMDSIDPMEAGQFQKDWDKNQVDVCYRKIMNDTEKALSDAKRANDIAVSHPTSDKKDQLGMFAKLAYAAADNAVKASTRGATAFANLDLKACLSAGDDAKTAAGDAAHALVELKRISDSVIAAQQKLTRASNSTSLQDAIKLKQEIDSAKRDADNADIRAKYYISKAFGLGQTCTDEDTAKILSSIRDSAFKVSAASKRASDFAQLGNVNDLKNAVKDATTYASDTEKLLEIARKTCEKFKSDSLAAAMASVFNLLPKDCGNVKEYNLNFDEETTGTYVTDTFVTVGLYNVSISTTGGSNNAGRILDSSRPGKAVTLGSPNSLCDSGNSGPGIGSGGAKKGFTPNCVNQRNVLIIPKDDNDISDTDAAPEGTITFTFGTPAIVDTVGLINLITNRTVVMVYTLTSRRPITYSTISTGANGFYNVPIKARDVTKIEIIMKDPAAVTNVRFVRCLASVTDDDLDVDDTYLGGGVVRYDGPMMNTFQMRSGPILPTTTDCLYDKYKAADNHGKLVCGMKHVYLDKIASLKRGSCKEGSPVVVDLKASMIFKSGRYDVAWYIGVDGGSALKGSCAVSTLEPTKKYSVVSGPGSSQVVGKVSWNNDSLPIAFDKNDACGDVFIDAGAGAIDMSDMLINQDLTCVDKNDDGNLDFGICFTFRTALNDAKCDPSAPIPSKDQTCYCARYDIPQISVEKATAKVC